MERNQAAGKALLERFDKSSITDMDNFGEELWALIDSTSSRECQLEILANEDVSLEFIVKILIKIGFSCEDSVRLMMKIYKNESVILARAEENILLSLQEYINTQAETHGVCLSTQIRKNNMHTKY